MADWKATVDGVGSFALAAMTVGSRGGGRAWVDLELEEEPELSGVRFGSRVTLTCRRGTCPVLEVCSFWRKDRHGRKVLRTVRPSGSRSPGSRAKLSGPHLLVRQRRLKEPVWPFIRRLGKELSLAEKNRASAGWLDRLEAVLPAGACFALEATMSPAARFTRAIESLGARTNLVTVLVRANPAGRVLAGGRVPGGRRDAAGPKVGDKLLDAAAMAVPGKDVCIRNSAGRRTVRRRSRGASSRSPRDEV